MLEIRLALWYSYFRNKNSIQSTKV